MTDVDPFRLAVDDTAVEGRAVTLSAGLVSAETLVAAIGGTEPATEARIDVDCPDPGPLHEFVGHIAPDRTFDRRGALAALARSRGYTPPQAAEIADLTDRLDDADGSSTDLAAARKRAATAAAEEERLREEVATARGRLQTLRDLDRPHADAEETFRERARRLTELQTERAAARERLRRLEREERRNRDARERRFELSDRLANRRREARAWLAEQVYDSFAAATAALADATEFDADAGSEPGAYAGDALVAAAAVARVGDVSAPLVVSTPRFGGAERAATLLDAPVVRLTR